MHINGSADKQFIDYCLNQIEDVFEKGFVRRDVATQLIYQIFLEIAERHKDLYMKTDVMLELMVEYFLKPLYNISPAAFGLAAFITVFKLGEYELKIVSRDQMNEFILVARRDKDPRVTIVDNWLLVIRLDQKFLPVK